MFKTFLVMASIAGFAAPALANDDWAERLGLEPGYFSLGELHVIANETPGPDRERRIKMIRAEHAAFDAAVRDAVATNDEVVSQDRIEIR